MRTALTLNRLCNLNQPMYYSSNNPLRQTKTVEQLSLLFYLGQSFSEIDRDVDISFNFQNGYRWFDWKNRITNRK